MRTTKQVFLDYNPAIDNSHWIVSRVLGRDDSRLIHSTYKDNPFLEKEVINEIERLEPTPFNIEQGTSDETLWKIYGLGQRAVKKGLIFSDVGLTKQIPSHYKKRFYGLDFGYTNHPTTLIEITLSEGELYFNCLIYKKGLVNRKNSGSAESIEEYLEKLGIEKSAPIWADAAEPKSIADLQLAGYNVQGAKKGADSVNNGIDQIKQYKSHILESCTDMIKERDSYKWQETKSGELTNTPVDAFNHCWDAASYGCRMELPFSKNKYKAQNAKDRLSNEFSSAEEKIRMYDAQREQEGYYD
jgi:phage terminase large subunit